MLIEKLSKFLDIEIENRKKQKEINFIRKNEKDLLRFKRNGLL